jgi:hypothetical protein
VTDCEICFQRHDERGCDCSLCLERHYGVCPTFGPQRIRCEECDARGIAPAGFHDMRECAMPLAHRPGCSRDSVTILAAYT